MTEQSLTHSHTPTRTPPGLLSVPDTLAAVGPVRRFPYFWIYLNYRPWGCGGGSSPPPTPRGKSYLYA